MLSYVQSGAEAFRVAMVTVSSRYQRNTLELEKRFVNNQ